MSDIKLSHTRLIQLSLACLKAGARLTGLPQLNEKMSYIASATTISSKSKEKLILRCLLEYYASDAGGYVGKAAALTRLELFGFRRALAYGGDAISEAVEAPPTPEERAFLLQMAATLKSRS